MLRLIGTAACIALALSGPAAAQDRYSLTVTQDQLNLIGKALGKLPFEEVSPTINDLGGQVLTQQKAAADARVVAENARLEKAVQDRMKPKEQEQPQ